MKKVIIWYANVIWWICVGILVIIFFAHLVHTWPPLFLILPAAVVIGGLEMIRREHES